MNNTKLTVRPHFVYVFTLLYPYLSLLIIPVIRGILGFVWGKNSTLSAFFAAEVIMLSLAFFAAVLKLRCTRLSFHGDITVEKGLVCRVRYTILEKSPKVILIESDPFSRILGIYRLKIYTEAGTRRRPDENIPIHKKTAMQILKGQRVEGQAVKSNTVGNVVMSAALSSAMTGFILATPAVKAIAGLLGEGVTTLLPKLRSEGLEPENLKSFGGLLPLLFLVGYAVSFAVILLRNSGFSSVKNGSRIMLDSGRLPHRTAFLDVPSVNAVKTVTAPLMRLAGKCAVKFSACGFGRAKGEIGLLVPCVRPSLAKGLVRWLLPQFEEGLNGVTPDRTSIGRCIFLPAVVSGLTAFAARSAQLLLPQLDSVILSVTLIAFVVIVLWLTARVLVLFKGRFSFDGRSCCILGQYGFGTVELQSKAENVEYILLSRTPFDKLHGHCTVKLKTSSKNRDTVRLRFIKYREVKGMLDKAGYGTVEGSL